VTHRIVWPITVLLGLIILAIGISNAPAQRRPDTPVYIPPMSGRFAVAHATATTFIILDTATGKLYKAGEADLLKASEMPKVGMIVPMPFPAPTDKAKVRPIIDKEKAAPIPKEKKKE
jgi:hypothetical protein